MLTEKIKIGLMLLFAALVILLVLFNGALADEIVAVRALETYGFSDIEITNHQWFLVGFQGCSSEDAAKFEATATNPAGQRVEVYVCAGFLFKGATVRTK